MVCPNGHKKRPIQKENRPRERPIQIVSSLPAFPSIWYTQTDTKEAYAGGKET
jgi:hypothetical protein